MNFKVGNDTYILLEERILHNKIRRDFNILMSWAKEELKREYKARFESLEDVEKLISPLGISIINEVVLRCEDILIKVGINEKSFNLIKDREESKITWEKECERLLSSGVAFKNPLMLASFLESLEEIILTLKDAIINKIIEEKGNIVSKTLSLDEKEKCRELVEEFRSNGLNESDALKLLDLNPYSNEVYKVIIDKLGDSEKDIEKLCEKMDVDYYILKSELIEDYYTKLNVANEIEILNSKENLINYGKYIGFKIDEELIKKLDRKLVECIKIEDEKILNEFDLDTIKSVEDCEKLLDVIKNLDIRTEGLKEKKATEIEEKLKEIKEASDEEKIRGVIDSYVFLSEEQVYGAIEEIDDLELIYDWTKEKACEHLSENIEKLIKEHRELLGKARRYEEEFINKSKKENIFENIFKRLFKDRSKEFYESRVKMDREAYNFITNYGERNLDDME